MRWTQLTVAALVACGATPLWACSGPAAKLVSLEGVVEVRPVGGTEWQPATPAQTLCTGDTLAVRKLSRAAVTLPNDVVLRLDQGSVLTLSAFDKEKNSELGLVDGVVHVLTRFRKKFGVMTPYMNAMVDGTEFTVKVAEGATTVAVTEGEVRAENEAGQQRLTRGLAARAGQGQSPAPLTVRPEDAVQWALYFPQIVQATPEQVQALPAAAREAAQLAKKGQLSQALAAWPADVETDGAWRNIRAGWLLGVGRVEDAQALLKPQAETDVHALSMQALIDVVRNQVADADKRADRAVAEGPQKASPHLAKSYALQARRNLPAALDAAKRAVEVEPEHAVAWARYAELQLTSGLLRGGQASAERALELNPNAPRARALLGFAQLLRGLDEPARVQLSEAQAEFPADPLPHLGLGLIALRTGQIEEGRREIEVAVMLDPGNSELRSMLARAYLNESRDAVAQTQAALAQEIDPRSPTPWFVRGLIKQRANDMVGAAADFEAALERNDQRAVVRPATLLDTDSAARSVALASVYKDLGFDGALLSMARSAVAEDPQSDAAHRLLAEAYASEPRSELARVSELLQAQLRQSSRVEPVSPQALMPSLPVVNGPRALTLHEVSPLFDEKNQGARLGLLGGNRGLWGSSATAWTGIGIGQISLGHFHYETDGYIPTANIKLDVNNVLWQTSVTPELNVQAEWRKTKQSGGDIAQRLVPESTAPERQSNIEADAFRIGLRYVPQPEKEWLVSVVRRDLSSTFQDVTSEGPVTFTATANNKRSGLLSETLFASRNGGMHWTIGASTYRENQDTLLVAQITLPVVPSPPPTVYNNTTVLKHNVGFLYADFALRSVVLHAGLVHDDYRRSPISVQQTSPKLGVTWHASRELKLRAAVLRSVRGSTGKEQTTEPTQFAGFNQLFDDSDGTRSDMMALGVDHRHGNSHWSWMATKRELRVPTVFLPPSTCTAAFCDVQWSETSNRLQWGQRHAPSWATTVTMIYEKQSLKISDVVVNVPARVSTWQIPARVNYFSPSGWSAFAQVRGVKQSADYLSRLTPHQSENFFLADIGVRWKLGRRAALTIDVSNLFDRDFAYQDTYSSGNPHVPLFQPGRSIYGRVQVQF